MLALPQEYIGALCEVKSLENETLAVGRVIKIEETALEITAREDEMIPLFQYRLPVKLYAHHGQLDTHILVAVVYLSTGNFLRLEEVRPLQNFERRGAFRVNSAVPGVLAPLFTEEEQAEFYRRLGQASAEEASALRAQRSIEVTVMDISLTGVRLRSAIPLPEGARFLLEFSPLQQPLTFHLRVQRLVQMPNGETQYGCIFFDYTERQMDVLCRDLFQLQRIEKNRRLNSAGAL
ncbi:MAG: PilZ domain-containing protein [Oscillospiraceae bacterium]